MTVKNCMIASAISLHVNKKKGNFGIDASKIENELKTAGLKHSVSDIFVRMQR